MPDVSLSSLLSLALGGAAVVGYLVGVRRFPLVGLVVVVLAIAFVPIWVGVSVGVFLPVVSGLVVVTAAGLVSRGLPVWTFADLLFAFLVVAALAPLAVGRLSAASAVGVLTVWAPGYLLGRLVVTRVRADVVFATIAVVFSLVGGLAVIEAIVGWHGLSSWGPTNTSRLIWGSIQVRAGLERAEGAFGHSIALGCSLSMAAVLTLEARLRPGLRLLMVAVMAAGAALTLSRLGIGSLALGLVLAVVFVRGPRLRGLRPWLIGLLVAGAAFLLPLAGDLLAASGDEAAGSADYRGSLVSLLSQVEPLGGSEARQRSVGGTVYFGGFQSIDSQLLLFGLSYGWFTLVLVLVLLAAVVAKMLSGSADVAQVAVVSQVVALAAVALITQYAVFFWIVAGLAVGTHALRHEVRVARDPVASMATPSTQRDLAP